MDAEPTPGGSPPDSPRRTPAREERDRPRKRGMGALALFLLFGLGPALAVGWFLWQPAEDRQRVLDRIPEGWGGRALQAGICLAVLVGLARVALPAFHGAAGAVRNAMGWIRTRPRGLRLLLKPAEFVLWLLWFGLQLLVAVDAALIVAACLATLLLVARILAPDLLPNVLPQILK